MNAAMQTVSPETVVNIIARYVGGRVVVDGGWLGFRVALNDERGTYVARVKSDGEIIKLTANGGRVDSLTMSLTDLLATF